MPPAAARRRALDRRRARRAGSARAGQDPRLEPADAARRCSTSRAASRSTSASRATTRRRSRDASPHAVDECDAVITSGAVSVGDYDFVKVVLERLARDRPASTSCGRRSRSSRRSRWRSATLGGVPVFGLPGNPVSSHVSFELFARPALRQAAGPRRPCCRAGARGRARRRSAAGPTASSTSTGCASTSRTARYVCERAGVQASNVLSGMAAANGLALLPDGDGVDAGGEVDGARCSEREDARAGDACQVLTRASAQRARSRRHGRRAGRAAWQPTMAAPRVAAKDAWLDAYFGTRRGIDDCRLKCGRCAD